MKIWLVIRVLSGFELHVELTLSILPISLNIQDPVERLEYTANTIHERLTTAEFVVINHFMNLMGSLPRMIADPIYIDFTYDRIECVKCSRCASISLSTLPGPQRPLVMVGSKVTELAFSVPPTIDLHSFCTLLSYNNQVTVTITVDAAFLSEEGCRSVLDCFNNELNTLVRSLDS